MTMSEADTQHLKKAIAIRRAKERKREKQSGPSGAKHPAYVTGTQQLDPKFWPGWDAALIASGDVRRIGEEMLNRYKTAGGAPSGFWIILHDRDLLADGTPKALHVHWVIQQSQGRKAEGKLHCTEIDAALGFTKSVTRAPGRGGRIENAHSYLKHAKDPDKFQYAVSDVVTLCGQDYSEIEASHRQAWARRALIGRTAVVSAKEWSELGDALVQKVLDGQVDELDLLRDKTLMDIYSRNEVKVNLALKNFARRQMLFEVEKLRAEVFQKTFLWIDGASQQGKTLLANRFAQALSEATGWRIYQPAARNAADDYMGQEIMLLNEPGSRAFEWPDWLTLTGPREVGPLSARYKNRGDIAPRVVIVAVSMDPVNFGFFIPGKRSAADTLDQLLLRMSVHTTARKIDGEPRYSLSRMGEVERYTRGIRVPKQHELEVVALTAGPVSTVEGLDCDQAVEVLIAEVAQRSPDMLGEIGPSPVWPAIEAAEITEPMRSENELRIAELQAELAAAQAAAGGRDA